ncbi:MAG: alcohol dehydrogenase catalytic domain-containing protein [Candidatus Binatia bacterium]|nr:alcohol dehydrogenase catalytic domain-containing protein [Candidatus Binatia bacterium]
MKALVVTNEIPKIVLTRLFALATPRAYVSRFAPLYLRDLPDPPLRPGWVRIRTVLCGLCGSDYKQVFLKGAWDNPMTAVISFPQVLGHEVVGYVDAVGPEVDPHWLGKRVVLNPWLSCAPRGIDPPCSWCARGDYAQCLNFVKGALPPGIHHGNCREATGGFAEFVPAHCSQLIPIPDDISFDTAVLADPFSVSLHATLRHPPPPEGTALVYGCGTLGLLNVAIVRTLFPKVTVLAIARYAHQHELARRLGAQEVVPWRPQINVIERVATLTGSDIWRPWQGLPMLDAGVDVVYDTVGSPETVEVSVRVTRSRGKIVVTGVEMPKRFEWTPLYFKELSLIGSNAFGVEEWGGRRQHAMEWYFDIVRNYGLDCTPVITHRFPLEQYDRAFLTCYDQGAHRAVKVLFTFPNGTAGNS